MANYSGKLLKFVYEKWDSYKILENANRMIKSVKEKTQAQVNNNIKNSTVLQELRTVQSQPHNPLQEKLINWWQWYQYLVGLNAVEKARQDVLSLQNKLIDCREIRRVLRREAFMHNNKIKEIYEELLRIKRDDPKYVTLTILENKTLQEQRKNAEEINLLEEEEKDYFVQLTTAINQYQEAQTINAQKYKYLSILASAVAALLSLISSMIYNNKRMSNIKQNMLEMQKKNEIIIANQCNSLEESISKRLSSIEANLIDKTSNTWNRIAKTINVIPQTKTESVISEEETKGGWLNTAKKALYIGSIILMLKGLIC